MARNLLSLVLLLICLLDCNAEAAGAWRQKLQDYASELQAASPTPDTSRRLVARLGEIARGGDINAQDAPHGETALMLAARLNHEPLVSLLLLNGADPLIFDKRGLCAHDFTTDSTLALRLVRCCRPAPAGCTLHSAVAQPEHAADTVLQLLRHGADIHQTDQQGRTALMLVPLQNPALAGILIAAGARTEHWGATERAREKVRYIDVVFTHTGATEAELEEQDIANAKALDELEKQKASWRRFRDKALTRRRMQSHPYAFMWSRRQKRHTHKNILWKQEYEKNPGGEDGISGYHGSVYRGTLTLHYDNGIPPLKFPVQAGGRARHFHGTEEFTAPIVPEGATARLYTDMYGHTIKGFFISCLGRQAIPQFSDTRTDIMLHLATVAIPGETEESTVRHTGSHGCISVHTLQDWEIISAELRKLGGAGRDGIEIRIRYDLD